MKIAVIASGLLVLPASAAMARGDGFGAALGGSFVGSTLGTVLGNSISRPPPPTYYYQPAPVYVQPRVYVPAAPVRRGPIYAASVEADVDAVSYKQGLADRDEWDSWFGKLGGRQKDGAAFWADQRGRPNPLQCRTRQSSGNDFMDGCTSAQRRLAASDDRRKTDAQYRNGWDKVVPEVRSASVPPPAPVPVPVAASAPAAAPPEAKQTSVSDFFNADMLGVEVPYLEKQVGPARRVSRLSDGHTIRAYSVDGCTVKAHVEGTSVYAYGMELSPSCNVSLKPFIEDIASTKNLTLGKFVRVEGDGNFHATCLVSCGKNDDGMASYHWQGPRPARTEIVLLFPLRYGASDDAADRVAKAMSDKEGPNYVSSAAFNCDAKYDTIALDAFKNASVSEIIIGSGIEDDAHIYKASCSKTN